MRLLSSHGELVRGRCGATNLCAYCARLAAVENSELLALDALYGTAPTLWAVLTTRTPSIQPADFYDARRYLLRALRARWPDVELAALVEFTTGYAGSSGGLRRPHWNLLVKGVPVAELAELAQLLRDVWCRHVDAEPQAQYVGAISEAGGLMRYLALHFQKESQAPPPGWHGHRFLKTRGYLWTATPEAREAAKASLRHKRELHRQLARGLEAHDAELVAHEALAIAAETSWRVIQLMPSTAGDGERPHLRMRRHLAAAPAALSEDEGAGSSWSHPRILTSDPAGPPEPAESRPTTASCAPRTTSRRPSDPRKPALRAEGPPADTGRDGHIAVVESGRTPAHAGPARSEHAHRP